MFRVLLNLLLSFTLLAASPLAAAHALGADCEDSQQAQSLTGHGDHDAPIAVDDSPRGHTGAEHDCCGSTCASMTGSFFLETPSISLPAAVELRLRQPAAPKARLLRPPRA